MENINPTEELLKMLAVIRSVESLAGYVKHQDNCCCGDCLKTICEDGGGGHDN